MILRQFAAIGVAAAALLGAANASAFCRTRSCDSSREVCDVQDNCVVSGVELTWPTSCIGFTVQQAGSKRHAVSAGTLEQLAGDAFGRWLGADCGGGRRPELSIQSLGEVECARAEYNQDWGNANIFMFRDDDWEAADSGHALALTTLWFNPQNGTIYDADIEINGTAGPLTYGRPQDGIDLPSILTHEVGHFLGLSHTDDADAVMRPFYEPKKDSLRALRQDDVAGICSIYTPEREVARTSCEPRHGFASDCRGSPDDGCSIARAGGTSDNAAAALVLALGGGFARLRRRKPGRA
jgi:MYXO-CTERM domain-containing protein